MEVSWPLEGLLHVENINFLSCWFIWDFRPMHWVQWPVHLIVDFARQGARWGLVEQTANEGFLYLTLCSSILDFRAWTLVWSQLTIRVAILTCAQFPTSCPSADCMQLRHGKNSRIFRFRKWGRAGAPSGILHGREVGRSHWACSVVFEKKVTKRAPSGFYSVSLGFPATSHVSPWALAMIVHSADGHEGRHTHVRTCVLRTNALASFFSCNDDDDDVE